MKKVLSLVLSLLMILSTVSALPLTAFADATEVTNFQQLKTAVAVGGDIKLGANINVLNTDGNIWMNNPVTLDLAGNTLNLGATSIYVATEATFKDSSGDDSGMITGAGTNKIRVGYVSNETSYLGTLNIESGTYYTSGNYCINVAAPGELIMNGGTVKASIGAVYLSATNSKLTMNNGIIEATSRAGVYASGDSKFTMSGGIVIAKETAVTASGTTIFKGGTVAAYSSTAVNLTSGTLTVSDTADVQALSNAITIKDDTGAKAIINGGTVAATSNTGITVGAGDELEMNGGKIQAEYIAVNNRGTAVINGGSIVSSNVNRMATVHIQGTEDAMASLTMTGGKVEALGDGSAINLHSYGKFTMNGGEIEAPYAEPDGRMGGAGITAFQNTEVTINKGTVTAFSHALAGNGSDSGGNVGTNAQFTVNGGTLTSSNAAGIYAPQVNGKTVIAGGTITGGRTGVEIRAGELTITDGSITGNQENYDYYYNKNGLTTLGAAVSVFQHTTKQPITVTISGGTFSAKVPFSEVRPDEHTDADVAGFHYDISGGVFHSSGEKTVSVQDYPNGKFISGGKFTHYVTDYVKDGYGEKIENDPVKQEPNMKAVYQWREVSWQPDAAHGSTGVVRYKTTFDDGTTVAAEPDGQEPVEINGVLKLRCLYQDEIHIVPNPDSGYAASAVSAADSQSNTISVDENKVFLAPDDNSTVTVSYDDACTVLGHSYTAADWTDATPPDCVNDGELGHYECPACHHYFDANGNELTDLVDPALTHDYEAVTTAPCCTAQGFTTYTCTRCGDISVGDYTDAIPSAHDFSENSRYCRNGCGLENPDYNGADAADLSTNDRFTMGMYPQTMVTDSDTITALNAIDCELTDYGYVCAADSDSQTASNVKSYYADLLYNGEVYRKVVLEEIRPNELTDAAVAGDSTPLYFKWEPIVWRVLANESDGVYVMAEDVLDAQAVNTYYENTNWKNSTLRTWLNGTFYDTAFSENEQASVVETAHTNEGVGSIMPNASVSPGPDTTDVVWLPSEFDLINPEYGFTRKRNPLTTQRRLAKPSDYALFTSEMANVDVAYSASTGYASFWMRNVSKNVASGFKYTGYTLTSHRVDTSTGGVRPVFKLSADAFVNESDSAVCRTVGHDWATWASVDDNNHKRICSICSKDETAAHRYGSAAYSWTKVGDDRKVTASRICQDCKKEQTETVTATGVPSQEPTCTAMGKTTYTATFDNPAFTTQTKTVDDIPANGHSWATEWSKNATHHWHDCTRCSEVNDKAAHNYATPTYTWNGTASVTAERVCDDCGWTETETKATTSEQTKDPTCTEMGETTYTATFDNPAFETQSTTLADIEALDHIYESSVTDPTCTAKGYTTYTCIRGDDEYVDDYTDALGHLYGKTGDARWTCQRCGKVDKSRLPVGWDKDGGKWYYYKNGVKQQGWLTDGDYKYYLDPATKAMITGWKKLDGNWYYFNIPSGAMAKYNRVIDGKQYYFNSQGVMKTGWVRYIESNEYRYFGADGAMLTGWRYINGNWYYLHPSDGYMHRGWLKDGGKWYYFIDYGPMVTGTKVINGKTYTFDKSGVCQNP